MMFLGLAVWLKNPQIHFENSNANPKSRLKKNFADNITYNF
jgi:hypothetical protein